MAGVLGALSATVDGLATSSLSTWASRTLSDDVVPSENPSQRLEKPPVASLPGDQGDGEQFGPENQEGDTGPGDDGAGPVGSGLPTTPNVQSVDANGLPDAADAVVLSLATDDNHSTILRTEAFGQTVALTATVTWTDQPVTIEIVQQQNPGGMSVARFVDTGSFTTTVTTSGGVQNTATVGVRGAVTGSYEDDFTFRALVDGQERGRKAATVVEFAFSPVCLYLADQRPVSQTVAVTPAVAGLQIESHALAFTNLATLPSTFPLGSPITILPPPQFPPTDAQGQAERTFKPCGISIYCLLSNTLKSTSVLIPQYPEEIGLPCDYQEWSIPQFCVDVYATPSTGTPDSYSSCQCGSSTDQGGSTAPGGKSIDPSDGEKKLDISDLVIPGRGEIDYEFRRVYRSYNYRLNLAPSDFGENWTTSYADERLIKDGADPDTATYFNVRAGQSANVFVNAAPGQWYSGSQSVFVELRKNPSTGDFEIRDESGLVRTYYGFGATDTPDAGGRLKEIRDRNDNRMTFHYETIDPDGVPVSGDEKAVLAFVIDPLGREIRYQYYAASAQDIGGRPVTLASPNPGSWGRLARVRDFKGDMDFDGAAESADFADQVNNRTLVFDYDAEGNLVRASTPAVAGTPNGNDFPTGATTRYQYITEANRGGLSEAQWMALTADEKARLLHKLTRIWHPNEVRDVVNVDPPDADAAEVVGYETDPTRPFFGFVTAYTVGGTNGNGVPSGGTITYAYTDLNPGRATPGGFLNDPTIISRIPSLQVDVTDRNGNGARYVFGGGKTVLEYHEFTRGFRSQEPTVFRTTLEHNADLLLRKRTDPEGNSVEFTFNERSTDRFQQGNLIRIVRTPDPARGGDQPKIEQVFVYEPIYNRPCLVVFARGSDATHNGFTPPIPDPAARTMPDPYDPTRTLNLRYARVEYFDYQESTERAVSAPDARLDIDGSGGRVNQSPLIGVDLDVLTTEVLLVQELGLPEDASGLAELRKRLSDNLTRLGMGDLNGDGDTTPTVTGNIVRTVQASPVLLAGSNQAAIEAAIEAEGDLIAEAPGYDRGGTAEGGDGDHLQTVVTMHQYNQFGQFRQTISPEGNVTTFDYFAEGDPDGDSHPTPAPADGRTLEAPTGGYLRQTIVDAARAGFYFDQSGNDQSAATLNNNRTNPAPAAIRTNSTYDDVGNATSMTDGRGIRTDFFVNERDQVVQVTRASSIFAAFAADPRDPLLFSPDPNARLTAFQYLTRTAFDYNGNVVLEQVEDRGNTSGVDGNGLGAIPAQAVATTPGLAVGGADPLGGPAFVDTLHLYDRIDDRIETRAEVDSTRSLDTRFRYDGNQNLVLTIHPEGNADGAVFDERDLLFQSTRGAATRPSAGRYAPGDPSTFDRPGGAGTESSTTTYNYDKNQNLVEIVDAQAHGGAQSAIAGLGDVTRMTFDGFDRRKTVADPLGNTTTFVYDPDSNVVRTIQDGDPIDDVAGSGENRTLSVTEFVHDELSRVLATHRVLFQTPDATPARTPTLTDTPAVDALAAYLADANNDLAAVPGAIGIAVLGRVTTLIEYDRESRLTFTVQDDLDVNRTDYDGASRVVKTTDSARSNGFNFAAGRFDPAALAGNVVETAYDDNHNPIERKETDVSLNPAFVDEFFLTTYLYDALDRLQTMVDNLGQTEDYRYDSRGNLVARADAVGPVTSRTIDRRGLGSTAPVPVNDFGNVTRTFYDGQGRRLQTESILTASGQGNGTYIGATLEGVKVDPPAGYLDPRQSEDGIIRVDYAFDDNSQLLALRDDDGNTTAYIYDNQDRLLKERKGLNVGYQGTAFSIAGGDSGAFREVRRPPTQLDPPVDTEPGGTDITFVFDRDSNVVTTIDDAGNIFDCTFDALDRKTACVITRAAGFIGTTEQEFTFDGLSRLIETFDNNEPATTEDDVIVGFFYDSLSRQVEEQQQVGSLPARATSNHFDIAAGGAVSQPSSLIYPDGRRVDSTYDALDRLVARRDDDQASDIGQYEYIGTDRVATLTYQNGTRLVRVFDELRRVVTQRWEAFTPGKPLGSGMLVVGFGYRYDRANNKLIEEKLHDPDNSEVYAYDSAYRLVRFERGTLKADRTAIVMPTTTPGALREQTWDLDGLGNWIANTHRTDDVSGTEERTHSDFNEIVTLEGTPYDGNALGTYQHDENGNLIDDGERTYQWDALNRLRKVFRKEPDGLQVQVAEYTNDSQNRRFRKVVSNGGVDGSTTNGATDFYYDGWRVVEEHDGTDAVTQQYTYGNYIDEVWSLDSRRAGITIAQLNDGVGSQRFFYHGNTLYNVYALTDEIGAIQEAYQYDAYGKAAVLTGPGSDGRWFTGDELQDDFSSVHNPYTYTGQRLDSETSLMYYKNRYYDTGLGRFISRDLAGYVNGLSLYAGYFIPNSTDPLGLRKDPKDGKPCGDDPENGPCCCCVDDIKIENITHKIEMGPKGQAGFALGIDKYTFDAIVDLHYIKHTEEKDCTLEWWETNTLDQSEQKKKANLKLGERYDLVKEFPDHDIWKPWKNRTKPCPGKEDPPVKLSDTPQSKVMNRTLKIEIIVKSAVDCPCEEKQKQKTLEFTFNWVDKTKSLLEIDGQKWPEPKNGGN